MTLSQKIHHLTGNANTAYQAAAHHMKRYQAFKDQGIRRRDAAAHLWNYRAQSRLAKGYAEQAARLEREQSGDLFMAAIVDGEAGDFLENWHALEDAQERQPITDMDMHTGERFTLYPVSDEQGHPKWERRPDLPQQLRLF